MACYINWDAYLEKGTPEYESARSQVEAKLSAVKHIVDYYYRVSAFSLPELPEHVQIDKFRQPKSKREMAIRLAICHHLACDELNLSTIWDVCSLLDEGCKNDKPYLAVLLPCASLLRESPNKYF